MLPYRRPRMTHSTRSRAPRLSLAARLDSAARSLLLFLAFPFVLLYFFLRSLRRGSGLGDLAQRLGNLPANFQQPAIGALWIHAVSVGETQAVAPIIPLLRSRFPGRRIFISTTTETGQALAKAKLAADGTFYFPLDYAFACRCALRAIQPAVVLIAETEFWPRFLREARRAGAAVAIVNGRISDRSFAHYHFWRRSMRPILSHVDLFLMQTEEDARRMITIGAEPARVCVCGNLKYDVPPPPASPVATWLANSLSLASRPVLIAGSVVAGEESAVLEAFAVVRANHPRTLLLLAPRRPERFDLTARQAADAGLCVSRRSQLDLSVPLDVSVDVFLLDTIGELAGLYQAATVAFVGGSLVPAGGHNIVEPAAAGVPALFGPSMENFAEIARMVLAAGAGLQVNNSADLGRACLDLLRDPARRSAMGRAASALMDRNRGAASRTFERITALLVELERSP